MELYRYNSTITYLHTFATKKNSFNIKRHWQRLMTRITERNNGTVKYKLEVHHLPLMVYQNHKELKAV